MSTPAVTILFIGVVPRDVERLRIDEESRAIEQAIALSPHRNVFKLEKNFAVRVDDLQRLLLQYSPQIVHFAGHGTESSELVLEDDSGNAVTVPTSALSRLFGLFRSSVRCTVLGACFSEAQAASIAEHIPCVIGMAEAITDMAAVKFAASFYQALAFGASVQRAYDLACLQIDLAGLEEGQTPKLLTQAACTDMVFAPIGSEHVQGEASTTPPPATFSTQVSGGQVGQVVNIDKLEGGLKIGKV